MSDNQTKSVLIYGAEWCPPCHVAKNYLKNHGIEYEYRNVDENQAWAVEAVTKSGQTGIPVIIIEDEIIIGFDRPKIDAALAL
jgi:glutaredoxin-like YruB-family protein